MQCERRALHGRWVRGRSGRGGLVGQNVSGNPAAPIIGAASGAAIGGIGTILAINSAKAGQRKQFQQGYDQGASDTVKRQYWILQNLQKGKQEPAYRLTYYRFTIPPDPDAVNKDRPASCNHSDLRMSDIAAADSLRRNIRKALFISAAVAV